jgi:hypothetical protein
MYVPKLFTLLNMGDMKNGGNEEKILCEVEPNITLLESTNHKILNN